MTAVKKLREHAPPLCARNCKRDTTTMWVSSNPARHPRPAPSPPAKHLPPTRLRDSSTKAAPPSAPRRRLMRTRRRPRGLAMTRRTRRSAL